MRSFDIAHVSASALAAFVPLLVIANSGEWGLIAVGTLAAAAGAGIASLVCRWWPGPAAPGWRLWLAAWLFNPLVIFALGFVLYQYECLLGLTRGWHCMALALVVLASPATLIGPAVAIFVHVMARREQPEAAAGPH